MDDNGFLKFANYMGLFFQQILWALDWNIGFSDGLALAKVIKFSLNAWYNQNNFMLETYPYTPPSRRRQKQAKNMVRTNPLLSCDRFVLLICPYMGALGAACLK